MKKQLNIHQLAKGTLLTLTICFGTVACGYSQSTVKYFKAAKASFIYADGRSTTPLDTDDIVLFDYPNNQIIVVSDAVQVYRIKGETEKYTNTGSSYIKYTVLSKDGKNGTILYSQKKGNNKELITRVLIDDQTYPMVVLDGALKKVY